MRRVAAVIVACGLAFASCGDDSPSESSVPDVALPAGIDGLIELEIIGGKPVGGAQTVEFSQGDKIRIELTGDAEDQIHVHAYDLYVEPVDGEGELEFDALITGTFEIELEQAGRLLVRMTVK